MIVTHLNLSEYRNYAVADVTFAPGANLFVGRNGQGKTNLVEALGYLSTLGSHRVSSDQALIRAGADAAVIRARLQHNGRDLLAEVQINRSGANRAQVNRGQIKPRELPRYFSSVLFAPEDLGIVRGDPSARRRFFDQLLILHTPRLAGVMGDYERTLKQRNSLLKSARTSGLKANQLTTLEIWDDRLVVFGSEIIDERVRLVHALSQPIRDAYASVVGDDHGPSLTPVLSIDGVDAEDNGASESAAGPVVPSDLSTADRFRSALAARRKSEIERGLTLVGPHRDDILFELNSLPVKGYASHGESWSFALALKLASAELLRQDSSLGDPVLILDDVFAELDAHRRARLAAAVSSFEQVLITAAVLADVPEALAAHTVHIEAGRILPAAETAAIVGDKAEAHG
ncbi:DNA replication/repair protein RecF [Mycetocola zhadangensis]|uniref:DNA replication and repair protein RecF n=1 Tax=Mycetocola zhadangensis TaxID=1164595 RepID=A0A3L7J6B1_9MICO|nr:DNA replication/repair protein RecF [Mycetocola zhadangensis]RLQ84052.1 DNA replication/repair protein RecF [Mycetocola zhadangensis]GGE96625.1 DNA replication and repair protein RecF [Mycetocola zhadangensis]